MDALGIKGRQRAARLKQEAGQRRAEARASISSARGRGERALSAIVPPAKAVTKLSSALRAAESARAALAVALEAQAQCPECGGPLSVIGVRVVGSRVSLRYVCGRAGCIGAAGYSVRLEGA